MLLNFIGLPQISLNKLSFGRAQADPYYTFAEQ